MLKTESRQMSGTTLL